MLAGFGTWRKETAGSRNCHIYSMTFFVICCSNLSSCSMVRQYSLCWVIAVRYSGDACVPSICACHHVESFRFPWHVHGHMLLIMSDSCMPSLHAQPKTGSGVPKTRVSLPGVQNPVHTLSRGSQFISAQRWVLGGNSTKLARLVTITSCIYTVKNVSSACQTYPPNSGWLVLFLFPFRDNSAPEICSTCSVSKGLHVRRGCFQHWGCGFHILMR